MRQKVHFFYMDLPQQDAPLVKAYPAKTTEAFLYGHVSAFTFFGGVPLSILSASGSAIAMIDSKIWGLYI